MRAVKHSKVCAVGGNGGAGKERGKPTEKRSVRVRQECSSLLDVLLPARLRSVFSTEWHAHKHTRTHTCTTSLNSLQWMQRPRREQNMVCPLVRQASLLPLSLYPDEHGIGGGRKMERSPRRQGHTCECW